MRLPVLLLLLVLLPPGSHACGSCRGTSRWWHQSLCSTNNTTQQAHAQQQAASTHASQRNFPRLSDCPNSPMPLTPRNTTCCCLYRFSVQNVHRQGMIPLLAGALPCCGPVATWSPHYCCCCYCTQPAPPLHCCCCHHHHHRCCCCHQSLSAPPPTTSITAAITTTTTTAAAVISPLTCSHVADGGHACAADVVNTITKVLHNGTGTTLHCQNASNLLRVRKQYVCVTGRK